MVGASKDESVESSLGPDDMTVSNAPSYTNDGSQSACPTETGEASRGVYLEHDPLASKVQRGCCPRALSAMR